MKMSFVEILMVLFCKLNLSILLILPLRYEYQRESSGVSSVKNFKTLLPASSKDVYYRDDIGNISTSHMKVMDDAVELDLRPRFSAANRSIGASITEKAPTRAFSWLKVLSTRIVNLRLKLHCCHLVPLRV